MPKVGLSLEDILKEIRESRGAVQEDIGNLKTDLNKKIQEVEDKLKVFTTEIKDICKKFDKISKKVNEHQYWLEALEKRCKEIDSLKEKLERLTENIEASKSTISTQNNNIDNLIDRQIPQLNQKISQLDIKNRINNLVISGIAEELGEDRTILAAKINTFLKDYFAWQGLVSSSQVFRRGKERRAEGRKVVVHFPEVQTKVELLKQSSKLKGSNIFLSPDFTIEQENIRFHLREFVRGKPPGLAKFNSNFSVFYEGETFIFDKNSNLIVKAPGKTQASV